MQEMKDKLTLCLLGSIILLLAVIITRMAINLIKNRDRLL